jgi:hypothetical protein
MSTTTRETFATELGANLPRNRRYRVIGFNPSLDAVKSPTVMVWQSKIERPEQFGLNGLLVTFDVWVLVGQENTANADARLDIALDDVLGALQKIGWVDWQEAERGVLFDSFQGWKVTVNAAAKIETES